jgi:hypothetical protein
VIVDNGSNDNTLVVAKNIQSQSARGRVLICNEPVKGFVPARSAGVNVVAEIARRDSIEEQSVLIVQADADVTYSKDYVECLRVDFESHSDKNVLLEGVVTTPFDASPGDLAVLSYVDELDRKLLTESNPVFDCVVDDKSVAYRLADYVAVGGLQREYLQGREYIYCGTTRMWIRMLAKGMSRRVVPNAVCSHSIRKISEGADIFIATAGWPRDPIWKQAWRQRFGEIISSERLLQKQGGALFEATIQSRRNHLSAMFVEMPRILANKLNAGETINSAELIDSAFFAAGIPLR